MGFCIFFLSFITSEIYVTFFILTTMSDMSFVSFSVMARVCDVALGHVTP